MLQEVAISQVLDRIRFENMWWNNGKIDPFYDQMPRRAYFEPFAQLYREMEKVNRALLLMGPRRVGKSVMLYHLVEQLIRNGVPARRILFITVENPIYINMSLEQLFARGREAAGPKNDLKGWHVIFDEIQYLKNWEVHLKSLVDSYRHTHFIASGSAAAALKYKSMESGAGRFTDFHLPPLTFMEFINMQGLQRLVKPISLPWGTKSAPFYEAVDLKQLNRHFLDYINFGGYPEAIFSESIRQNPERFIRQDVVDKVLLRDLPSLYGIHDVQELNALFTTIAYNTAREFSLETLSKQSGTQKNTIKKYLEYLESAFLIKSVRRLDQSGRRFQRDNFFKVYLTNPSLRAALFSPLQATDEGMGELTETAIYAQWLHREKFTPWYARWSKGEVDMVGLDLKNLKPNWALEIKWSDRYVQSPHELKSLLRFCKENKLSRGLVTTINHQTKLSREGIDLYFVPASSYAYTVSANTLQPN
jgi:predicted AAA+ superfamily ATPase